MPTRKGIEVLAIEFGINILTFSIGRTFVSFRLEYAKRKGIKVLAIEKGKTFDFFDCNDLNAFSLKTCETLLYDQIKRHQDPLNRIRQR